MAPTAKLLNSILENLAAKKAKNTKSTNGVIKYAPRRRRHTLASSEDEIVLNNEVVSRETVYKIASTSVYRLRYYEGDAAVLSNPDTNRVVRIEMRPGAEQKPQDGTWYLQVDELTKEAEWVQVKQEKSD